MKLSSAQRAALMDARHGLLLCSERTGQSLVKQDLAEPGPNGGFSLTPLGRAKAASLDHELATRLAKA